MRLRFSCVAFVPPGSQLGVSGSPDFLGRWDPCKCLPLLPYSSPSEGGIEPSLWFADVEVNEKSLERCGQSAAGAAGSSSHRCNGTEGAADTFSDKLIAAITCRDSASAGTQRSAFLPDTLSSTNDEASSIAAAAYCRVDHRAPRIAAILEQHPLKRVQFEYKFILWNSQKPVAPYVPDTPGESFQRSAYGSPSCTWRTWLFPPAPAQHAEPPSNSLHVIWEGSGPETNRKFFFDPMDVVVDESESGSLELKHIRQLKEELKVTVVFNMQTADDMKTNFPDPLASKRTPEAAGQLYESAGLRYVWMPTEDMSDACRKLAVAQCALILDALIQNGHSVYVHCNAGVGRSVAAVSAYLCFCVGLDVRKVNFLVSTKRPVAYWDEKAIEAGLIDFNDKYGRVKQPLKSN